MRIGLDFDNTIVSYNQAFYRAALERGLIPGSVKVSKDAVKDYLMGAGKEDDWTGLQGCVYGTRMDSVEIFPGAIDFIVEMRRLGNSIFIVSQKTKYPYLGPKHDLHAAAWRWLERIGFCERTGVGRQDIYFEQTKHDKMKKIASLNCTHYVDDLPEILMDPVFPEDVVRIQFSPGAATSDENGIKRLGSWDEIREYLTSLPEGRGCDGYGSC